MLLKLWFMLVVVCVVSATTIDRKYLKEGRVKEEGKLIEQDENFRQFPQPLIQNDQPPSGYGVPFGPYSSPQLIYTHLQGQPQGYPGQPQILYYSGPGQPFLVNPGHPPGNFLIPTQPIDPNIYRAPQPQPGFPQSPVFIGGNPGYPQQPAQPFVPPIEKDAEEIPKSTPQQGTAASSVPNVPQLPGVSSKRPTNGKKPEKIELDEETEESHTKTPTEPRREVAKVHPGQRFFILNGQQLFGTPHLSYQHIPSFNHEPFHHRKAPEPQQLKRFGNTANIILRNQPHLLQSHLLPSEYKDINFAQQPSGLPLTLHNQVVENKADLQSVVLTDVAEAISKTIPSTKDNLQSRYFESRPIDPLPIFDGPDPVQYGYYKYSDDSSHDGAIIIDAKYQEPNEVEAEGIDGITERPAESSVAEAQPSAVALAGVGGVAAAGPRGTSFVGKGGLAVSSPHATAVAGPSKEEAGLVGPAIVKAASDVNKDKEKQRKEVSSEKL